MTISTFIFIHDQDILIKYLNAGKFKNIPNLKFVFLGNKPNDKIKNLDNIIVSKDLPLNIEEYPKFTSFTGWYSLWKNNLIKSDYVNLFEYDINLSENFYDLLIKQINDKPDFLGYIARPIKMFDYVSNFMWVKDIIPSINKNYKINIYDVIENVIKNNPEETWSCTSNSTFSYESFNQYMKWFSVLIDDLKFSNTCGHAHERSISFFYFIFNKNVKFLLNELIHFQMDSHKTQHHIVDFDLTMSKLLENK